MKILQLNDTHKGFSRNTDKIHQKFFQSLKKEDFDVIIHCGDMIATQQRNVSKTFKQLRDLAKDKPVLVVRGNHDYWQDVKSKKPEHGWMSFEEILDSHKKYAKDYNITLLDEGETYYDDEVFVGGFTTWYASSLPVTNDCHWMNSWTQNGDSVALFLSNRQHSQLSELSTLLTQHLGKTRVVVSHMPVFGKDWEQKFSASYSCQMVLRYECEYYLCGHSHKLHTGEELIGGVKVFQTGSDYDQPRFLVIDV